MKINSNFFPFVILVLSISLILSNCKEVLESEDRLITRVVLNDTINLELHNITRYPIGQWDYQLVLNTDTSDYYISQLSNNSIAYFTKEYEIIVQNHNGFDFRESKTLSKIEFFDSLGNSTREIFLDTIINSFNLDNIPLYSQLQLSQDVLMDSLVDNPKFRTAFTDFYSYGSKSIIKILFEEFSGDNTHLLRTNSFTHSIFFDSIGNIQYSLTDKGDCHYSFLNDELTILSMISNSTFPNGLVPIFKLFTSDLEFLFSYKEEESNWYINYPSVVDNRVFYHVRNEYLKDKLYSKYFVFDLYTSEIFYDTLTNEELDYLEEKYFSKNKKLSFEEIKKYHKLESIGELNAY